MDYDKNLDCIVRAVYHEARGEPVHGQMAVAKVVLNRIRSPDFPGDACKVIKQKNQFPWVKAGAWSMQDTVAAEASWAAVMQAFDDDCQFPYLYFHRWRHKGRKRSVMPCAYGAERIWIGDHIFYGRDEEK